MNTAKAWHYQEQIKWKENPKDVCESALMGLWLIVDKDKALKDAVAIGCHKHGAKKTPVTKMIRSILPSGFLRKKAADRMTPDVKQVIRVKKIAEHDAKKFMKNEEPEIVIVEKVKKLQLTIPESSARKYKAYAAMKGETMSALFLKMFNEALRSE